MKSLFFFPFCECQRTYTTDNVQVQYSTYTIQMIIAENEEGSFNKLFGKDLCGNKLAKTCFPETNSAWRNICMCECACQGLKA